MDIISSVYVFQRDWEFIREVKHFLVQSSYLYFISFFGLPFLVLIEFHFTFAIASPTLPIYSISFTVFIYDENGGKRSSDLLVLLGNYIYI